jgi:hypothetical protein
VNFLRLAEEHIHLFKIAKNGDDIDRATCIIKGITPAKKTQFP